MTPNTSAFVITYNEQEMLPYCLKFLDSMTSVGEIIVVDSYSTDNTPNIVKEWQQHGNKPIKFHQRVFDNFCNQRNFALSMAEKDWILYIDADETYSSDLNRLLHDLNRRNKTNFVRIATLVMFPDRKHYIQSSNTDPHIRVWRRGFAEFRSIIHEWLSDKNGRNLHCDQLAPDVINCAACGHPTIYPNVIMKHYQLLKSDECLKGKGLRWQDLGMLEESCKRGIPVHANTWYDFKHGEYATRELPTELYDVTTG